MQETVTFSFSSAEYENVEATETFSFEELGIDRGEAGWEKEVDRIYEAWVWSKLNVSGSIIIEEGK